MQSKLPTTRVKFINLLQAAFACADAKSTKKTDNLTVFFALLWSECVKDACRALMRLTAKSRPKNVLFDVAPLNDAFLEQYFIQNCFVIHYVTQVTHLLFFYCKIGDFKIAGCVCLQKKFIYLLSYKVFFGDFKNYTLKTN